MWARAMQTWMIGGLAALLTGCAADAREIGGADLGAERASRNAMCQWVADGVALGVVPSDGGMTTKPEEFDLQRHEAGGWMQEPGDEDWVDLLAVGTPSEPLIAWAEVASPLRHVDLGIEPQLCGFFARDGAAVVPRCIEGEPVRDPVNGTGCCAVSGRIALEDAATTMLVPDATTFRLRVTSRPHGAAPAGACGHYTVQYAPTQQPSVAYWY